MVHIGCEQMTLRIGITALITILCLSFYCLADTGDSAKGSKASDFVITKWTTEKGLPQNTVTSIAQTPDGYLWIGTFGGLARFDGFRFVSFDSTNLPGFTDNRVLSLYCDSNGSLWIGSDNGAVFLLLGNRLLAFESGLQFKRKAVWGFEEDSSGHIYIASTSGVEMYTVDKGAGAVPASGRVLTDKAADGISKDPDGNVWVKISDKFRTIENGVESWKLNAEGYFFIRDGQLIPGTVTGRSFPKQPQQVRFAPDGKMMAVGTSTLAINDSQGYREIEPQEVGTTFGEAAIEFADGEFWCQQGDRLFEFEGDRPITHSLNGYVANGSRVIFFDNFGNIWLGTQSDGLVRLSKRSVRLVKEVYGTSVTNPYSIIQDAKRNIWIAGENVLKITGDTVRKIEVPNSLRTGAPRFRALAVDREDKLWVGADDGLYRVEGNDLIPVNAVRHYYIQALFFDRDGTLWIGTSEGLGCLRNGAFTLTTSKNGGIVDDDVHCIFQSSDGSIWVGTRGGLTAIQSGRFVNYTTENGLPHDSVRDIVEDNDGSLWIATYGGGLGRLRDGQFRTISRNSGLGNNFISRIIIDGAGYFWLLSNKGVFKIAREELNSVADGIKHFLISSTYDDSDGMSSSEANGGHQSAGILATDGRLWFPMIDGVAIIDPGVRGQGSFQVVIEGARSKSGNDEVSTPALHFDQNAVVNIENGVRNLEIDYTAFSFAKPESLRFLYKLEGLDADWTDAGSRRTAFYPYLPPGDYTFLVKAIDANGNWSKNAGSVFVSVRQKFWESNWFLALGVIAVLFVVSAIYRSRMKHRAERQALQVQFGRKLIDVQESERQSIARNLHDSTAQTMLGVNLNLETIGQVINSDDRAATLVTDTKRLVEVALTELRNITSLLFPPLLDELGFEDAVRSHLQGVRNRADLEIEVGIDLEDELDRRIEIAFFRIIQEAVHNAQKYSRAKSMCIGIQNDGDQINLWIEDNGVGIAHSLVGAAGDQSVSGGHGLNSMRSRIEELGGRFTIESDPTGTRIHAVVRSKRANR